jgi:hypothetical protein
LERQSFVDWMKAVGMLLIVTGHIVGDPHNMFNSVTQPIYTKQLGVAFFVFVMGWSLANDTRDGLRVVYNRIFPVYFYGFVFAVLLSSIYFIVGHDINESNYLPFFGGINVLFNNFPANPTTWYIGTYLHLLLFWYFFLRGKEIGVRHLAMAFVFENIFRCALLAFDKSYIAYMLLPNWLTVFLLGAYVYKKRDVAWSPKKLPLLIIWGAFLLVWSSSPNLFSFDKSFPFRSLINNSVWALPLRSFLISIIYLINTLVFFELARCLPRLSLASFFARNTLIIFIVHMPIIYAFSSYAYGLFDEVWLRKLVWIFVLYIGLALVSELIQKSINIKFLCGSSWGILQKSFPKLLQNSA